MARAAGYVNAGTCEFLLARDGSFYFLEMNTRLQVEHPVTEMVTGLDLVEQQILVAMGAPLGFGQDDLSQDGHAIECRLYAEDPAQDFLPATGTIHDWHVPEMDGLRVDAGVTTGSEVGIFYDPMLAKIVTHAPTRLQALQRMIRALEGLSVQGVRTNRELLLRVLEHPELIAGRLSTHFLQDHVPPSDRARRVHPEAVPLSCLAAMLFEHERRRGRRAILPDLAPGWRNSPLRGQHVAYRAGDRTLRVEYQSRAYGCFTARVDDGEAQELLLLEAGERTLRFSAGGVQRTYRVVSAGDEIFVHSQLGDVRLLRVPRFPEAAREGVEGGCVSPMPGKISRILVEAGQSVQAGDALIILEAMKMEHTVSAPAAGTVQELLVAEGGQVAAGVPLVRLGPEAGSG
jgi:propionyl-CoA carboxylase alpha chain